MGWGDCVGKTALAAMQAVLPGGGSVDNVSKRADVALPCIYEASRLYPNGLPVSILAAMAWVESRWNPSVTSKVGARGLMQVMPSTWDGLLRIAVPQSLQPLDPYSAYGSALVGAAYTDRLRRRMGLAGAKQDMNAVIGAYFLGYKQWNENPGRADPYVRTVLRVYEVIGPPVGKCGRASDKLSSFRPKCLHRAASDVQPPPDGDGSSSGGTQDDTSASGEWIEGESSMAALLVFALWVFASEVMM